MTRLSLPQEIIAAKRDGAQLSQRQIVEFVSDLAGPGADAGFSDAQVGAMAMAIVCRGMDAQETAQLTHAMAHSGAVLNWRGTSADALNAPAGTPVLDKHSTGGVGDKVSLLLAPILAACGAWVPMISGRGLGHTGGTLDKLQSLPGYRVEVSAQELHQVLRSCACAIVGASADIAPADRRLYAIRDVTATVESLPLITASILSKKLAAGLEGLVMDVKVGRGAFMADLPAARALARSLVRVASDNGLPTTALITDMAQPLGFSAGNAVEVDEALHFLRGTAQDTRLRELTLALAAEALMLGRLAHDLHSATGLAAQALDSGRAAEHFARMVRALGGPSDVLRSAALPSAPVVRPLLAEHDGWLTRIDTLALGWAVVALGGGRRLPGAPIDPRVGLSGMSPLPRRVERGEPLFQVHAADQDSAQRALVQLRVATTVAPVPAVVFAAPAHLVIERIVAA